MKAALLDAFLDGEPALTTADVLRRVRAIRPMSEVKRADIGELRRWARDHLALDAVRGRPAAAGERLMEFEWSATEDVALMLNCASAGRAFRNVDSYCLVGCKRTGC